MSGQRAEEEKLGLKELVAMGIGGMVGGGIFSVLGLSDGNPLSMRHPGGIVLQ